MNVKEQNLSSNEFIAWKIRSSDYIQCGWTGDIGGKALCGGLWIYLGGLWKLSSDMRDKKGFVVLPKRWVVERTFGWLNWCRRLSKDYERLVETSETFIYIAMIRIAV